MSYTRWARIESDLPALQLMIEESLRDEGSGDPGFWMRVFATIAAVQFLIARNYGAAVDPIDVRDVVHNYHTRNGDSITPVLKISVFADETFLVDFGLPDVLPLVIVIVDETVGGDFLNAVYYVRRPTSNELIHREPIAI